MLLSTSQRASYAVLSLRIDDWGLIVACLSRTRVGIIGSHPLRFPRGQRDVAAYLKVDLSVQADRARWASTEATIFRYHIVRSYHTSTMCSTCYTPQSEHRWHECAQVLNADTKKSPGPTTRAFAELELWQQDTRT